MANPLPPGATLGMLGGGQLGRMFIDAAHALGYRVHVYCPEVDGPASQVADAHTQGAYDDLDAIAAFAASVEVVTYEFENVPAATAAACAKHAPVRPGENVLRIAQDRIREKTTLQKLGVPVGPFAPVNNEDDLRVAAAKLGYPGVLKTSNGGYDGKGQRIVRSDTDVTYAWEDLGRQPCVYEAFVDFEQEVSVVAARSADGHVECFGPIANTHRNHILDISVVPSGARESVEQQALEIATQIMNDLQVVGVLCVEFFQTRTPEPPESQSQSPEDQALAPKNQTPLKKAQPHPAQANASPHGSMLVNELAPRPHNSGHLTIDAYNASQFELQVRAVCGLPLIKIKRQSPAAMVNLLGDLWPTPTPGSVPESAPGSTTAKPAAPSSPSAAQAQKNPAAPSPKDRLGHTSKNEIHSGRGSGGGAGSGGGGGDGSVSEPDWAMLERQKNLHLHLYGKTAPRPGRKMGHLTALARTSHEAIRDAVEARVRLAPQTKIAPD